MSYKLGDTIVVLFQTSRFSTGAAYDATGTPVGTVVKNGADDGLTVTVTKLATGQYKAVFTPTTGDGFAAGDIISLRVTATVDSVAAGNTYGPWRLETNDLDDVFDSVGTRAAAGGAMTLAANAVDAAAVKADAVTKIQSGLATALELGKVRGAVAGKKEVDETGTQRKLYDANGALLVTLDYDATTRRWTPTWA